MILDTIIYHISIIFKQQPHTYAKDIHTSRRPGGYYWSFHPSSTPGMSIQDEWWLGYSV